MSPKVCVVSALYHPSLGGLGRQAQLLTERLKAQGVDLFVIARRMKGASEAAFSPDVEVICVPAPWPSVHILEEVSWKNVFISVVFSLGCLGTLIRNRGRYDLVHFHGASIPLFLSLPFLSLMRKKVLAKVASVQGTEAGSLHGHYGPAGRLLARMMRRVDGFVAISGEIHEGLIRDGIAPERIHRIGNFVDETVFHPPAPGGKERLKKELGYDGTLLVLYAGRLAPIKGLGHLLEAWSRVEKDHPRARLLLLGEGPIENELKGLCRDLGIAESVRFGGRVENIQDYFRAADVFVLSSIMEGLPNSLLEAMASGLPVVATRVGGVADVAENGRSALLVDPADASGLAEGLRAVLADGELRGRLGRAALETIRSSCGLESRVRRYIDLYGSLLKRPRSRRR